MCAYKYKNKRAAYTGIETVIMTAKSIKVLIVDDSEVARDILRALLEGQDGIEVVAEAVNGREAIELTKRLCPDLITMDLNMPIMSGLEAIEHIMHDKAVPILVVSNESDAELAYKAIGYGALEVIAKPRLDACDADAFVRQVRLLAGVPVITHLRRRSSIDAAPRVPLPYVFSTVPDAGFQQVFVIAASTGGPQALASVLSQLPADFPAPVLIAQHISDGFIDDMALWLSGVCPMRVKVAEEGELLRAGCVYLSPSEQHLSINAAHCVTLQERRKGDIYHPSCDILLSSVAEVFGSKAIGIIMTGMGRDGPEGMRAIFARGGITLAQDEASSIIYGMNAEAVKLGVIQRELGLAEIASEMLRIASLAPANVWAAGSRGEL